MNGWTVQVQQASGTVRKRLALGVFARHQRVKVACQEGLC